MNRFALLCAVIATIVLSGCEADRPNEPVPAIQNDNPAVTSSVAPIAQPHPDPAGNGGSSLPASSPYTGTATVQQNVNAAPFLVSSPANSGSGKAAEPNALTSRADGTMSGPTDQPAASTGWGTPREPARVTTSAPVKPSTKKKK